jgi:hypothetical protein
MVMVVLSLVISVRLSKTWLEKSDKTVHYDGLFLLFFGFPVMEMVGCRETVFFDKILLHFFTQKPQSSRLRFFIYDFCHNQCRNHKARLGFSMQFARFFEGVLPGLYE